MVGMDTALASGLTGGDFELSAGICSPEHPLNKTKADAMTPVSLNQTKADAITPASLNQTKADAITPANLSQAKGLQTCPPDEAGVTTTVFISIQASLPLTHQALIHASPG